MKPHVVSHLAVALGLASCSSPMKALVQPPSPVLAPAVDRQMLFRVRGPNGATIFLLGSVHLLSSDAGKLPAVVDSIFERSRTIAFETSIDSLQARAMEMFVRARYTDGR